MFATEISAKNRDRVFSHRNTLETVLSSTLEDKSLKNAVTQFYVVHQKKRAILEQELKKQIEIQKQTLPKRAKGLSYTRKTKKGK